MKILITGGCGFIGANLISYLIDEGHDIAILDNLVSGKRDYVQAHGLPVIIGDIRDQETVRMACKGMEAIVHLAAHTNIMNSITNPSLNFTTNVMGHFNLLEACREHQIQKFIFASSNAAVGQQSPPINEKMIPAPLSPYGASKLAGEALCSAYYHSFGIKTVSLRFANAYGSYSGHKTSVVATFIKAAKAQKPLVIFGNGDQTRDFIHVKDICKAIDLVLESSLGGEIFQIGTGVRTRIRDLAEMVVSLADPGIEIVYEKERSAEIKENFSNINKAKQILSFQPESELKDGLTDLWQVWDRQHEN